MSKPVVILCCMKARDTLPTALAPYALRTLHVTLGKVEEYHCFCSPHGAPRRRIQNIQRTFALGPKYASCLKY